MAAPHTPDRLDQATVRLLGLLLQAPHERLCAAPTQPRAAPRSHTRRTHVAHRADTESALVRTHARARGLAAREGHDVRAELAQTQPLRAPRDRKALEAPVRVVQVRQVCARGIRRQGQRERAAYRARRRSRRTEWRSGCVRAGTQNARQRAPGELSATRTTRADANVPLAGTRPAAGGP
jgi:hypothetical protein